MKLPKILTNKTFGVPNWIIGAVGLGVAYVSMNGFPSLNSTGGPVTVVDPITGKSFQCPANYVGINSRGQKICCAGDQTKGEPCE